MSDLEREARVIHRSLYSCGDNSCIFGSPGGMATNGGCRCFDDLPRTTDGKTTRIRLSRGIMALRDEIAALRAKLAEAEAKVPKWVNPRSEESDRLLALGYLCHWPQCMKDRWLMVPPIPLPENGK